MVHQEIQELQGHQERLVKEVLPALTQHIAHAPNQHVRTIVPFDIWRGIIFSAVKAELSYLSLSHQPNIF